MAFERCHPCRCCRSHRPRHHPPSPRSPHPPSSWLGQAPVAPNTSASTVPVRSSSTVTLVRFAVPVLVTVIVIGQRVARANVDPSRPHPRCSVSALSVSRRRAAAPVRSSGSVNRTSLIAVTRTDVVDHAGSQHYPPSPRSPHPPSSFRHQVPAAPNTSASTVPVRSSSTVTLVRFAVPVLVTVIVIGQRVPRAHIQRAIFIRVAQSAPCRSLGDGLRHRYGPPNRYPDGV